MHGERDLLHVKELHERFLKETEALCGDSSLKPRERVSAAIGIARFTPGRDKDVEDTFRQADTEMHNMKKEMKAGKSSS
ncbi:MAG: hypothetical protein K5697_01495 [Lachnospiraceae bacterium]|nr:hypothetical protein [Lachnospiraceae bacterium]